MHTSQSPKLQSSFMKSRPLSDICKVGCTLFSVLPPFSKTAGDTLSVAAVVSSSGADVHSRRKVVSKKHLLKEVADCDSWQENKIDILTTDGKIFMKWDDFKKIIEANGKIKGNRSLTYRSLFNWLKKLVLTKEQKEEILNIHKQSREREQLARKKLVEEKKFNKSRGNTRFTNTPRNPNKDASGLTKKEPKVVELNAKEKKSPNKEQPRNARFTKSPAKPNALVLKKEPENSNLNVGKSSVKQGINIPQNATRGKSRVNPNALVFKKEPENSNLNVEKSSDKQGIRTARNATRGKSLAKIEPENSNLNVGKLSVKQGRKPARNATPEKSLAKSNASVPKKDPENSNLNVGKLSVKQGSKPARNATPEKSLAKSNASVPNEEFENSNSNVEKSSDEKNFTEEGSKIIPANLDKDASDVTNEDTRVDVEEDASHNKSPALSIQQDTPVPDKAENTLNSEIDQRKLYLDEAPPVSAKDTEELKNTEKDIGTTKNFESSDNPPSDPDKDLRPTNTREVPNDQSTPDKNLNNTSTVPVAVPESSKKAADPTWRRHHALYTSVMYQELLKEAPHAYSVACRLHRVNERFSPSLIKKALDDLHKQEANKKGFSHTEPFKALKRAIEEHRPNQERYRGVNSVYAGLPANCSKNEPAVDRGKLILPRKGPLQGDLKNLVPRKGPLQGNLKNLVDRFTNESQSTERNTYVDRVLIKYESSPNLTKIWQEDPTKDRPMRSKCGQKIQALVSPPVGRLKLVDKWMNTSQSTERNRRVDPVLKRYVKACIDRRYGSPTLSKISKLTNNGR